MAGRASLAPAHAGPGRPLAEFRGAVETGRYRWLARDGGGPVGYIDCGTYDRWTTWDGGTGGRGVIGTIPVPSGSISYVVDPARRRRGYATAMIIALTAAPELAGTELLVAGIEPENAASAGCLRKAGFRPLDPEPDWEGIVYYAWRRPGNPGQPAGGSRPYPALISRDKPAHRGYPPKSPGQCR